MWISKLLILHGFILLLISTIVFSIVIGIKVRKTWLKQVFFNLSAVIIAVFLYELFLTYKFSTQKSDYFEGTYNKNFSRYSEVLGYAPIEEGIVTSKKYSSDSVLKYDVAYTIKNSRRSTLNSNTQSVDYALFFGCSFTFGEGLNDTATLPYLFNKYSALRYNVINYGFSGYGPHQMLAIVENQLQKDIRAYNKKSSIAIYSFISDHILRAAGKNSWDKEGPRYELLLHNLKKMGRFSDKKKLLLGSHTLTSIWTNTAIYKKLFNNDTKKATEIDVLRTLEVINKTKEILQNNGIRLYLILWDCPYDCVFNRAGGRVSKTQLSFFVNKLRSLHIPFFFISDIIPDIENESRYFIKGDGHPNAYCNEKIAKFISNKFKN